MNEFTQADTSAPQGLSPEERRPLTEGARAWSIMKTRFVALNVIAVAVLLAGLTTNARAISIRNARGAILERKSLSGTVSHVDQKRHSFTLTWRGRGMLKMERYWPSYQEEYQVTDGTVYKNGSWAKIEKGTHLRIAGRSYVATLVEFTK
jgi:hypothetical protein